VPDGFGQNPEMGIAGSQLRPGVANTNNRLTVKHIFRKSLVFHPAPVDKAHFIGFAKPFLTA
jgi:hypothetical protein